MRSRTTIRLLFLVLTATVVFQTGACRRTPATDQRAIVVAVENDLVNLDPIRSQEPYSLRVIGQVFEGLVGLSANNEIIPGLAESWSHNETYDLWTFEIRPDVYFHEDPAIGPERTRAVDAEDVVFSFQRVVSKDSYPAFVLADALEGVETFQEDTSAGLSGVRATGPMTVEMALVKPEPSFLHRITSPWFAVYPREVAALGPDVFGRSRVAGTGPYRLVSRMDNEVVLARHERHWQGAPEIERLIFRVIKNEQIRLSELRNGNVDIMVLPVALAPAVIAGSPSSTGEYPLTRFYRGRFNVESFPTFNSHFIGMNCDRLDVHVRRAISLGINREELLRAVVHGTGAVTAGTVPVGLLGYQPPYPGDIFDPEEAREALLRSSFRPANDRIELLVHEKDNSEQLGQLVQAQLARIGITVDLVRLDYNSVVGRMIQGETQAFALALEYVFSAPEPTLNNIFHSDKIPVPNFWRYRNPLVDRGLDDLRLIGDRSLANELARHVEKQIIDDAPAAFLYQLHNLVVHRSGISGVSFNGHSIPLFAGLRLDET